MHDLHLAAGDQPHTCPSCFCDSNDCDCRFYLHTDGNMKLMRRSSGILKPVTAGQQHEIFVSPEETKASLEGK